MKREKDAAKYVFKPLEEKDAPFRLEAVSASIEHLNPWHPWADYPYLEEDNLKSIHFFLENNAKNKCFGIWNKESTQYLGEIKLLNIQKDYYQSDVSLAYWTRQSAIRHGVASFGVKSACHFVFTTLELRRIEIMIHIDNIASQKFIESMGACYEGILYKKWVYHDTAHDAKLYSFTSG